jgi:hypothetical protein
MKKLLLMLSIIFTGCVDCNCGTEDDNLLDITERIAAIDKPKDVTQDKNQ